MDMQTDKNFSTVTTDKISIGYDPAPPGQYLLKKALVDSDLDGVMCGAILKTVYPGLTVALTKPGLVQQGTWNKWIDKDTVIADLSYVKGVGLYFDHHSGNQPQGYSVPGRWENAPCAAEIVYEYFKDVADLKKFRVLLPILGKFDYGTICLGELARPDELTRLAFAVDRQDNQFNSYLIDLLATKDWQQVMADPRVKAKIDKADQSRADYYEYLKDHIRIVKNIAIVDNREFAGTAIHAFFVARQYPEVDAIVMIKAEGQEVKFTLFRNNFNKAARDLDLLAVAKKINPAGSGGHKFACGFDLPEELSTSDAIKEIISLL
jgi:hypothetical protein